MIKIAVIEDNESLRQTLNNLFDQTPGMKCVLSAGHLLNIAYDLKKAQPNIILMDIGLPSISGIEGVRIIKAQFPEIQILMFTVFEEEEKIFDAIRAGASGYLLKRTPLDEIIEAIMDLYGGGAPMTASIARKVLESFRQPAPLPGPEYKLTPRELEILYSLVDGLSYKKMAEKYWVSVGTIRTHISKIYEKLHVHSMAQAVAKVLKEKQGPN